MKKESGKRMVGNEEQENSDEETMNINRISDSWLRNLYNKIEIFMNKK